MSNPNKYQRKIPRNAAGLSDVYDVLVAFDVTNPAVAHAIKKLLMPGQRGSKGVAQDLKEAAFSIGRAVEMLPDQREPAKRRPLPPH